MMAGEPSVLVMANCTHHSLALVLRKSGGFATVRSAELYSMSDLERDELARSLDRYHYVMTLEHGEGFGPLATNALRDRLGDRLLSLPTPFFSGLMPDMAYLRYGDEIARTPAVLGDYHSGLLLEEVRAGFDPEEIVRRYVSGEAFERLDVQGVWDDSLAELKARELNTDIAISPYIERCVAKGTIATQFMSFNHPAEGLINYIARAFLERTVGGAAHMVELTREEHNLYADAFWPLHPVVSERLGLPRSKVVQFKQPARLGGNYMEMDEFARRSVRFFTEEREPAGFAIATPHYLIKRLAPAEPNNSQQDRTLMKISDRGVKSKQIILTHFGRSGSTVLAEMLKNHEKIFWLNEYFSLKWINDRQSYNFTLDQMMKMVGAEVANVHERNPDLWVGHEIKLMNFLQNPSCNMVDYARATADPDNYAHIILRRRNVLKRICSVYKAAQTKIYHVKSDDAEYRKKTFRINFSNLVDYDTGEKADSFPELIAKSISREEQVISNFRNAGIRYLELVYEDDIEGNPLQAYEKTIHALGLEYQAVRVSLSKTSGGLKAELENYDELEEQMRNSEYAWMLA